MEFTIEAVSKNATQYDVKRELARILHGEDFYNAASQKGRPMNFDVKLKESTVLGFLHAGEGTLTLPTRHDGDRFLRWLRSGNRVIVDDRKLFIRKALNKAPPRLTEELRKLPFVDPAVEQDREQRINQLSEAIQILSAQFGVFYVPKGQTNRAYSVEWDHDCGHNDVAFLSVRFDHKVIRIDIGDSSRAETCRSIVVKFPNISKIGVGVDSGNPFICFELHTPTVLEEEAFYRTLTGDDYQDNRKYKQRLTSIDPAHARVAPYAHHLRLTLIKHDDIRMFAHHCRIAGLPIPVKVALDASKLGFFSSKNLKRIHQWVAARDWATAFQIEVLLHNCLVNTAELLNDLYGPINELYDSDPARCAGVLRSFVEALQRSVRRGESALACFNRVREANANVKPLEIPKGMFSCHHVTFTPTRMILEGPYAIQGNRVIRDPKYQDFQDHFIRVDFRDEDRLQYRWDREVDGSPFLQERVGGTLKNGFELGGRWFEFLAYSSSALREHSTWFVSPFSTGTEHVTAESIRQSLGVFTKTVKQPAKYAARMAQAFTATDPSVVVTRDQWEEVDDLGQDPYLHTDGVGTISRQLANNIWKKLCEDRPGLNRFETPSTYQIRFLGYKGMVAIDDQLEGIRMRLRPSMNKFSAHEVDSAILEIARAFYSPMTCTLNRSLIMILEDRGCSRETFMDMQNKAKAEVYLSERDIKRWQTVLKDASLGHSYRLGYIADKLHALDLNLSDQESPSYRLDHDFIRRLVGFTIHHTLRDMKHGARIPVKKGWLLPGVADEGPTYAALGRDDIFTLEDKRIFACVQGPEDKEPIYLKGSCIIWRSPAVHPGDVQRVYAIGEPPKGKTCFFRNLKNCVVLPSVGDRSLASMLGGGDLDGDIYYISKEEGLMPMEHVRPASYIGADPLTLDRPANVQDICDFIVDYIQSDVLGMLSDRHLVIADQSKEGTLDKKCLELARLCSLAVDYPKSGVRVDYAKSPRFYIPFKPDWKAAEVVNPQRADYYESTRALGYLYRDIDLPPLEITTTATIDSRHAACTDNVSILTLDQVQRYLPDAAPTENEPPWLKRAFQDYLNELRYISVTHTLSNIPGTSLTEEEIVIGTILAECSQRRWRRDRMQRVRDHSSVLVHTTEHTISITHIQEATREEALVALERAWCAWCFSVRYRPAFGTNSFGLITLGLIFACIDRLEVSV